jgi:hypothetical protein
MGNVKPLANGFDQPICDPWLSSPPILGFEHLQSSA